MCLWPTHLGAAFDMDRVLGLGLADIKETVEQR
jgi:hypothetical protein